MTVPNFFTHPILNSPYEYPSSHWELDETGQPTGVRQHGRRPASFVTPVPAPKKQGGKGQKELQLNQLTTDTQRYDPRPIINELRLQVDRWRELKDPAHWHVTPETARLLQHWRHHKFEGIRPFFCQIEAVETAIWLAEVASQMGKDGKRFLDNSSLPPAEDHGHPRLLSNCQEISSQVHGGGLSGVLDSAASADGGAYAAVLRIALMS